MENKENTTTTKVIKGEQREDRKKGNTRKRRGQKRTNKYKENKEETCRTEVIQGEQGEYK